jgi:hypothetical protein
MHRAIPDALVTGHAALIPGLSLPDPNDRHVLAAAIAAGADVIVTLNIKDFPPAALARHGLVAQHPDAFLQSLIDEMPSEILDSVQQCVARLTHPRVAAADYVRVLRRLGLAETASFLEGNPARWHP